MTGTSRSYEEAIKTLNGLQTNASVIQNRRLHPNRGQDNLPITIKYLARAGISLQQLDALSVIHVTGTKGKGSTCAFTERILRERGYRTGLYTSPHLVSVTERIRLDGQPIHKDDFTKYFWQVYDALYQQQEWAGDLPAYFKFLTVLALKVFLEEGVDVALLEVGIGGEYDCTNIVRNPVVCGITTLDLDHTALLGTTLPSIAWHKAGIMKEGAAALTVEGQDPGALRVMMDRAREKKCRVQVCPPLHHYGWSRHPIHLGLSGAVQRTNASLALQLAHAWLSKQESSPGDSSLIITNSSSDDSVDESQQLYPSTAAAFTLSVEDLTALREVVWPGRSQVLHVDPRVTLYLDGAHTCHSMEACADWFTSVADLHADTRHRSGRVVRVLVFNATGDRDVQTLLKKMVKCRFDLAIFTTNMASRTPKSADQTNFTVSESSQLMKCQRHLEAWEFVRAKAGAAAYQERDDNTDASAVSSQAGHDQRLTSKSSPKHSSARCVSPDDLSDSPSRHCDPASNVQRNTKRKEINEVSKHNFHVKVSSKRLNPSSETENIPESSSPQSSLVQSSLTSVCQGQSRREAVQSSSQGQSHREVTSSALERQSQRDASPTNPLESRTHPPYHPSSPSSSQSPVLVSSSLDRTHMLQLTHAFTESEMADEEEMSAVAIPYIQDAVNWIRSSVHREGLMEHEADVDLPGPPSSLLRADHVQVLVTGSLHLVGGVLAVLQPLSPPPAGLHTSFADKVHRRYDTRCACTCTPGAP